VLLGLGGFRLLGSVAALIALVAAAAVAWNRPPTRAAASG